jgi:hypothetical protein
MRTGAFPAIGKKEAVATLTRDSSSVTWQPSRADVSGSADLGYTWGSHQSKPAAAGGPGAKGYYVRIWKRSVDKPWRIVLDVMNAVSE